MKEKLNPINNLLFVFLICTGMILFSADFSFSEDKDNPAPEQKPESFFAQQEKAKGQESKARYDNFLSDYEQEKIAQQRAGSEAVSPAPTYSEWLATQKTEKSQLKELQKPQDKVEAKESKKLYKKQSGR